MYSNAFDDMSAIEQRCWREAIGFFVSEADEKKTPEQNGQFFLHEQLCQAFDNNENADTGDVQDQVSIWLPFEGWLLCDLLEEIQSMADNLLVLVEDAQRITGRR